MFILATNGFSSSSFDGMMFIWHGMAWRAFMNMIDYIDIVRVLYIDLA